MVQEARSVFNATPVNARKCQLILTKLLFLLSQGEHLGANEATDTFFAMTKLFQCKDVSNLLCFICNVLICSVLVTLL